MTLQSRKVFSAVHMSIIVLSLASSPLAQAPRERLGVWIGIYSPSREKISTARWRR